MPKIKRPRLRRSEQILYYRPTAYDNLKYTFCYIFYGTTFQGRKTSYIGKTPDPFKRYKEHCGIQNSKNGAVRTWRMKEKEIVFLLGGHPTERHALQCEWRLKHITSLTGKDKPRTFCDRIYKIGQWLKSSKQKWTQSGTYTVGTYILDIWIKRDFYIHLDISQEEEYKYPHLRIHVVDKITQSLLKEISSQSFQPIQAELGV